MVLSIVSVYPETMTEANIVLADDLYISLTKDEALAWLGSISLDQLTDFVIIYDYVEHADAEVTMPGKVIYNHKIRQLI